MKLRKLLIFSIILANFSLAFSQNKFDVTFLKHFPDGQNNQVTYINFPVTYMGGYIEVTITGGYVHQLTTGKLTKRFIVCTNHNMNYFDEFTEVPCATGEIAKQWKIGDFDKQNYRIPIYHLANTGNDLIIEVKGNFLYDYVNYETALTMSNVVIANNIESRHYTSIMQDRVGIGTLYPNYRLDVNGTVHAKEVKVDLNGWPDFVFQEDYKLMPLQEVEQFIKTNNHLPEIPSEEKAIEKGINLGEMNAKLLQKIEELTLYLIEQNNEIITLKERIKLLEKE